VRTDVTGLALKEMLAELEKMADQGLTDGELAKVRAQDRAELVQTYETTSGIARRLGTLALLGLPPGFDAVASRARQAASVAELGQLARAHVDPKASTIVVVGPRSLVEPQLAAIGLGPAAIWDAEGTQLSAPKKALAAPAPAKKEPAAASTKKPVAGTKK
jgi:zinc protease